MTVATSVDASWTPDELAHELCDLLVAKGQLKEKPAFIRTDREAKIASLFSTIGLDGAKMCTFDNPGPLEMLVRKGSAGEVWVAQVVQMLTTMLPEEAASAQKKMGMDQETKDELAAAKEKSTHKRELREQEREEQGDTGKGGGGDRGGNGRSGGYNRDRDDGDQEPRGGRWTDAPSEGKGGRKGGSSESMECFNCGTMGHSSRDCPEPRKEKGKKGGGKSRDRSERQCLNCKGYGHMSRDCPEPVDEDAVRERLAAKAAKQRGGDGD